MIADTEVLASIKMEAWMQLEDPAMTVEQGREELELAGNKVLEIGSRYTFEIIDRGEPKIVPAWGKDMDDAEMYMEKFYPEHYEAKYTGISHVGRCFLVADIEE